MYRVYMGSIMLFASGVLPRGWAYWNGQELPLNNYPALFSLLGTTYGGNGMRTFGLPKMEHANPNLKYIICLDGLFPM